MLAVLAVAGLMVGLVGSAPNSGVAKKGVSESAPDRMSIAWTVNVARSQNGIITDGSGEVVRDVPRRGNGAIAASDKVIAVADAFDVQLLDPATGRVQKRLSRVRVHDTAPVIGLWLSGDVVIVETGKIRAIKDVWIDGFEYTTGRLLWSTSSSWDHDEQPKVEVSSGVVVHQEQNREGVTVLTALAADTGQFLWSKGPICSSGADDEELAPAGKILAVLARCRDGVEMFGIELTKGSISWRNQLHTATRNICLKAEIPVIMVDSGDWFSLFDPAGKILLTRREIGGPSCAIHTTDRGVIIARNSVIQLIDLRSGHSQWQKPDQIGTFSALLQSDTAGGRLYRTHYNSTSDSELLPTFVSSTDISTGDTFTLPLPVRAEFAKFTKKILIYQTTLTRTIRYTGIRPEIGRFSNPALAGATPNSWPNACNLLSSADLSSLGAFTAFPEEKNVDIFGVKLPHPTRCNYLAVGSENAFSVTVSWVGSNRTELAAMLESQAVEIDPVGTPERLSTDAFITPGSRNKVSEISLLCGLYALHIKVPEDDLGGSNRLARKVAKILFSSTLNYNRNSDQKSNNSAPFDISAAHLVIRSFGYDPDLAPTPPGPLRGITAICADSATAYCQQVFFFFGQDFIGVGSGEVQDVAHRAIYHVVKITGQDGQTVRTKHAVYGPDDGDCCPSSQQSQTYRYKDDKLEYRNDAGRWQPTPKEPIEPG
ncbi:MAG: PQQ-binding-like beta-propeller repeat protein [Pseudonocardiaceae bacterium]